MQDASSSMDTLRALSRMAGSGMNIITVIHQPRYSLYELFDSVLLLGAGGVTVYSGPPLLSELWFTRNGFSMPSYENVADWNLDIISGCVFGLPQNWHCPDGTEIRCVLR
jgi:ABC-type multidrug transport system ATPase subunit